MNVGKCGIVHFIYRKRRVKTSEEEFIVNVQRIVMIVEYISLTWLCDIREYLDGKWMRRREQRLEPGLG